MEERTNHHHYHHHLIVPWVQLVPTVKNYKWGTKKSESLVACLYEKNNQQGEWFINKSKKKEKPIITKEEESRKTEPKMLIVKTEVVGKETPFAELWMGLHTSGMCHVVISNQWISLKGQDDDDDSYVQRLDDFIKCCPEFFNHNKRSSSSSSRKSSENLDDGPLPYLFKILSISCPLSIQAHPDKFNAEKLHKLDPSTYRDPNHKPEMAIALTRCELFCGFRTVKEVARFLLKFEELQSLVTHDWFQHHRTFLNTVVESSSSSSSLSSSLSSSEEDLSPNNKTTTMFLRYVCVRFLQASGLELEMCINQMMKRITNQDLLLTEGNKDNITQYTHNDFVAMSLFRRLYQFFPSDSGLFFVFLLQYHEMDPGQCLFIGPNKLHAYIIGDLVEIMANSDNVVRGGLTPKFKDVDLLVQMLYYDEKQACQVEWVKPQEIKLPMGLPEINNSTTSTSTSSTESNYSILLYSPPKSIKEFQIYKINLQKGAKLPPHIFGKQSPAIAIVLQGGSVLFRDFTPPLKQQTGVVVVITTTTDQSEESSSTEIVLGMGGCLLIRPGTVLSIETTTTTKTENKERVVINPSTEHAGDQTDDDDDDDDDEKTDCLIFIAVSNEQDGWILSHV